MKEERISLLVDSNLKEKAIKKAKKNDTDLSKVVRKFLRGWVKK